MKYYLITAIAGMLILSGCAKEAVQKPKASPAAMAADIVYTNGKIYTVNETQPWAEAVAIKDGKFVAVGSAADVKAMAGEGTEVVDLGGQFVMPGLVDTHTHPFDSAFQILDQLVLDDPQTLQDIQQQVLAYSEANPDKEWILGLSWPKGMFPGENPHRSMLDAVIPDTPICLMDQGGHANWCNTKALEITGIMDPGFEIPAKGIVERDEAGVPSGTIRETTIGHVKNFTPKASPELYAQAIDYVQDLFVRNGVTAHRTAEGDENDLIALKAKADANEIKLHWAVGMNVNFAQSTYTIEERMQQIANRGQYASEFVNPNFAKIFLDADVSGYGIWMLEPFPGTEDNYGEPAVEVEDLNRWTAEFDQQGISVQYHAVGSASIAAVADALELAAEANGGKLKTRHYPDHNGFPTARDLERFARLTGLVGYAPYFAFEFPGIHASYAEFLGAEALGKLQPARDTIDAGAMIGTGTDFSSLPQDPWPLLEGMVHRRNPWVPESESTPNNASQAITLEEAIKVYTLWGAHALLAEDNIGSIEAGKYADFVVLDRNLLEITIDDIDSTEVLKTVFSGKVVYEN
ncbi:MAG: amidohydrolase [Halioglobus sp.]